MLPEEGECLDPETHEGWRRLDELLCRSSDLLRKIRATGRTQSSDRSRWKILGENLRMTEQALKRLPLEFEDLSPVVNYLLLRREALSCRDPLRFLDEASSLYAFVAEQTLQVTENPCKKGDDTLWKETSCKISSSRP